jgi:predicted dehydrogenase
MKTLRVGVVGVGHLGYHHARNYALLDGVTLVGVADPDATNRAKAAKDFGVPGVADAKALIDLGVDAVSVVTPTTTHARVALELIEAGVHVLVEKPIAPKLAEAEQMVAAARQHKRILQVGHIERFNGAVMAVFDAFKEPKFVECHRLSPFPMRGTDVSVVLDLMIHDLDIVRAMDPSDVVSIDAVGVPVFSKSEDIANVRIRFASGCVANITSSRVSVERMRKIRIFAESAYVSTDYSAQEVLVYRKKPGPVPAGVNPMEYITIEPLPVEKDEPLKLELASFASCVLTGARPLVSGEDGVRALALAQQVIEFIRSHA